MLVRLVDFTHMDAWLVVIEFNITLLRRRINIRNLIGGVIFTEEDFIKFRVPTN